MTTWRERLRPASFSGILFHVEDTELAGGRRAAVHEFPLRDRPFVQELGRLAWRFSLTGYLVGDDYAIRRDRLRAKFETASPGFPRRPGKTLVVPSYGAVKVLCLTYRFRETLTEGRIVRFSAEFVEVGEEIEPAPAVAPVGATDVAAAALTDGAEGAAAEGLVTAGVVEEARQAISTAVSGAIAAIRRADVFSGPARAVAELESDLSGLSAELSTLVTAPADLAARIVQAFDSILDAAPSPLAALEAYRTLFRHPPFDGGGPGFQGDVARENARLIQELLSLAALAGAARAAARARFESIESAELVRSDLSLEVDRLAEEAADGVVPLLDGLRAAIARAVPPPERDLPRQRTITLPDTVPALVLAHELYQDEERAEEIVARNSVRHPLRIPGFRPLLVLSR